MNRDVKNEQKLLDGTLDRKGVLSETGKIKLNGSQKLWTEFVQHKNGPVRVFCENGHESFGPTKTLYFSPISVTVMLSRNCCERTNDITYWESFVILRSVGDLKAISGRQVEYGGTMEQVTEQQTCVQQTKAQIWFLWSPKYILSHIFHHYASNTNHISIVPHREQTASPLQRPTS